MPISTKAQNIANAAKQMSKESAAVDKLKENYNHGQTPIANPDKFNPTQKDSSPASNSPKPNPKVFQVFRRLTMPGPTLAQSEPDLVNLDKPEKPILRAKQKGGSGRSRRPTEGLLKLRTIIGHRSRSESENSSTNSSPTDPLKTAIDNGQVFFPKQGFRFQISEDDLQTPKVSCVAEKAPLSWSESLNLLDDPARKRSNSICTANDFERSDTDGLAWRGKRDEQAKSLFGSNASFDARTSPLSHDLKKKGLFSRTKKTIESFDDLAREAKDIMGMLQKDITKLTRATHETLTVAQRTAVCLNQVLGDHFISDENQNKPVSNLPDTLRAISGATAHCTTCAITVQKLVESETLNNLLEQTLPQLAVLSSDMLHKAEDAMEKMDTRTDNAMRLFCDAMQKSSTILIPYLLVIITLVGLAAFEALMPKENFVFRLFGEFGFSVLLSALVYHLYRQSPELFPH